jgi:hypothetical protein
LGFERLSLVPSEGPLISDQLRRGPLLRLLPFFALLSTYCHCHLLLLLDSPPPLPPPTQVRADGAGSTGVYGISWRFLLFLTKQYC